MKYDQHSLPVVFFRYGKAVRRCVGSAGSMMSMDSATMELSAPAIEGDEFHKTDA